MRKLLLVLSLGALISVSACSQEQPAETVSEPEAATSAPKATSTLPPDPSPASVPEEDYASDEAKEYCENLSNNNKSDEDLLATLIEYHSSHLGGINYDYLDEGCPKYKKVAKQAESGVFDGTYTVGDEMDPGTYQAMVTHGANGLHNCYWERSTGSGDIIDNNFINFAPDGVTVTVKSGEGFTSENCGAWKKIS